MTTIREYFEFILVVLFYIACSSFPGKSIAADGEAGQIIVGRYVPQRSAIRPSIAPGRAITVDTSPDDIVKNAVGADKPNNKPTTLNELDEKDFAAITTDTPLQHVKSEIDAEIGNRTIPAQFSETGGGSNLMQSTSGISNILTGSSGAINNTVNRATSSIGQTISGATGFIK